MTGFPPPGAVWAPTATTVELMIEFPVEPQVEAYPPHPGRQPVAMRRTEAGWWMPSHPLEVGTRYRVVLDGEVLPDPRSRWQPDGPEGVSVVVDPDAFRWTDLHWHGFPLGSAVFYELHVGTFTAGEGREPGTYAGVIGHLDDLVDLGVNAIELLPLATFPGARGWGYDGVALGAPHPAYGDPSELDRLVDEAHGRGIAVVVDVVYNHLGPSGNHLARFGPYFTDRYRTPWGEAVNLDGPGSHEVRRFFIDNALGWIRDHHIDGLRLDAVHAFGDRSAVPFLEELTAAVHAEGERLGRTVWVIGESDLNDPRLVRSPEVGGHGLDAVWSDDLHHALHALLTGERDGYYADFGHVGDLAKALRDVYVHDGGYSPFRGHAHGRPVGALPRTRFLGYAQNHDQIGNRAQGERLVHLVGLDRAAIAAAIVLLGPFVPMLFQGEEWAASAPFQYFTDHTDPGLAEAVRVGRRAEFAAFGWRPEDVPDPQDPATFARSTLDWSERCTVPHDAVLAWHRELLRLRRDRLRPDLATSVVWDEDAGWLRMDRLPAGPTGSGVSVAVNLGDATVHVPVPVCTQTLLLASSEAIRFDHGDVVTLPPNGVAILAIASAVPSGGAS